MPFYEVEVLDTFYAVEIPDMYTATYGGNSL